MFFHQAESVRVVQPLPVLAGPQGPAGESVHAGEQPVVSGRWFHAAGLRDHAPGSVHSLCQRRLVSVPMFRTSFEV